MTEPVADSMRSILDGHIVLTRELADRQHFPAVGAFGFGQPPKSGSEPAGNRRAQQLMAGLMSAYRRSEDLINIGAYAKGTNPTLDKAMAMMDDINRFLTQPMEERADLQASRQQLLNLMLKAKERRK